MPTTLHTLEIDSIVLSYGEHIVLSDIYLKLETGNICALAGRNGSGKSSLLKIIFGSKKCRGGFIRIDEAHKNLYNTITPAIKFLPATPFIPMHLTVEDVFKLHQLDTSELEDVLLMKHCKSRIGNLSYGELRYIEAILLLSSECDFLLLDEPFAFLAPLQAKHVCELIVKESAKKGIIIVDHLTKQVMEVANRFLLLEDGHLREFESKELLMKTYGILEPEIR